jgi:GTP-binding protein
MLDEELMTAMAATLPEDIPHLFISSITQYNIQTLKDLLWKELNKESFHDAESIVHKPLDIQNFDLQDDLEVFEDDDLC